MRTNPGVTAGSEYDAPDEYAPTDEELGVGVDDTPVDPLRDLLDRPEVSAAIDALVNARVEELRAAGVAGATPSSESGDAMARMVAMLVTALDKHSSAQAQQMPGHVKPLPVAEIEARAAAYAEMLALIEHAEQNGQRAAYTIMGDGGFYADEILWEVGQTIYWPGPPAIDMEPQNDIASRIYAAMNRWIGGHQVHIADRVAQVYQDRRAQGYDVPEPAISRPPRQSWQSRVEQIPGIDRRQVGPNRIVGTVQEQFATNAISPMMPRDSGPRTMGPSRATEERPSGLQGW
jgi:hypothetical protein